jgi:DNA-binding XRE family transcriptional regulator
MNNQEFKTARENLGLSVNQLGIILNTNSVTIRRWEANPETVETSRMPNPIGCQVIRWMLDNGFRPPEWPKDI